MDNIFEEDEKVKEEQTMSEKKSIKDWLYDNWETVVPIAAVGSAIGLLASRSKKKRNKANLEAEKELIGQIAYQAGQKDAYRDVATRRRKNNHRHHNNNVQ